MAQAEEKDLVYDAGDDEEFNITIDRDITGWTIYFDLIRNDSKVINREITSHDDPVNGLTGFTLSDDDTSPLSGNYLYEMKYKTDNDSDETFLKGRMTFV